MGEAPLRNVRFLRTPALAGSELMVLRAFKGAAAPDRRSLYELSIIDRADKTIVYRGNQQRMRSGMLGLRTPFEAGKLVRHHAPETRARMLAIDGDEIAASLAELSRRARDVPDRVSYFADGRLHAAMNALFRAVELQESALEQQERLTTCALRMVQWLTRSDEEQLIVTPSAKLSRARELLHDRSHEDVSLDDLAREVGVTKHYLVRSFAQRFGVPPHRYLMQIRVERARMLLLRGRLATHVAHECGFYDQSHLNRWFQREVGMPPARYAAGRW